MQRTEAHARTGQCVGCVGFGEREFARDGRIAEQAAVQRLDSVEVDLRQRAAGDRARGDQPASRVTGAKAMSAGSSGRGAPPGRKGAGPGPAGMRKPGSRGSNLHAAGTALSSRQRTAGDGPKRSGRQGCLAFDARSRSV
jgi:hypothetical protein